MIRQTDPLIALCERLEHLEHGVSSARLVKQTLRDLYMEITDLKRRLEALEARETLPVL